MGEVDKKRLIVALDYASERDAWKLLELLAPSQCRVKIGKELFTRSGPDFVGRVVAAGYDVFLDLKFHDIPNTVAGACSAAADMGCWMVNVHASGGRAMMEAASERLAQRGSRPLLIAVTVLTSLDAFAVRELGFNDEPEALVSRLAQLSQLCGMDGVVCSPQEIRTVKRDCDAKFICVTPGVRPLDSRSDDQQRVATPSDALGAGADYLVIGRPITQAPDPALALEAILEEMAASLSRQA